MAAYILRRLLLMIPTVFGILLISFTVVQFAPGGPVERVMAQLQGTDEGATARFSGGGGDIGASAQLQGTQSRYRGAQGLDPQFIAELNKQFGFDKPAPERFLIIPSRMYRRKRQKVMSLFRTMHTRSATRPDCAALLV